MLLDMLPNWFNNKNKSSPEILISALQIGLRYMEDSGGIAYLF